MSKGEGIFDGVVEMQFAAILQCPLKRAVSAQYLGELEFIQTSLE